MAILQHRGEKSPVLGASTLTSALQIGQKYMVPLEWLIISLLPLTAGRHHLFHGFTTAVHFQNSDTAPGNHHEILARPAGIDSPHVYSISFFPILEVPLGRRRNRFSIHFTFLQVPHCRVRG